MSEIRQMIGVSNVLRGNRVVVLSVVMVILAGALPPSPPCGICEA